MKFSLRALLVLVAIAAIGVVVAQNRYAYVPEPGIPEEAYLQGNVTIAEEYFDEVAVNQIESVRVIYFDKETWDSGQDAQKYLESCLATKSQNVAGSPEWSQGVGHHPQVEGRVTFKTSYLQSVSTRAVHKTGRLLLWDTECVYQDATGVWYFVSVFDHFHARHPDGDSELADSGLESSRQ